MRELKFRAYDKRNKTMLHSSVIWGENYPLLPGITYESWSESTHAGDISELMQYIGLKDKNGVEIYEGDICRNEVYGRDLLWVWEYRVDGEYVGFLPVCISDEHAGQTSTFMSWTTCEVIGNIYQNKDLVE